MQKKSTTKVERPAEEVAASSVIGKLLLRGYARLQAKERAKKRQQKM